jgi:hypothetical protein
MGKSAEVSEGDGCVWYTSTDFSRFFHDYIKHTHRLDWLQKVFGWLCQTHPSSWLTLAGFSMTISSTHLFVGLFVWYSDEKTCWSQLKRCVLDIVMENPGEVSRGDGQQVFQWLYQTHQSPRLTSAGFSMTISNTSIASTDFTRCSKSVKTMGVFDIVIQKPSEVSRDDGYVWYSHGKTWWSQSRRWVCLT